MQAKTLVLTHFSGRYRSGKVSASAIEADSADEQRQSLMILKHEAEAGLRQRPGRHPATNSSRSISNGHGGRATVACAFDGFTWRLPLEPRSSGAERGGRQSMHGSSEDEFEGEYVSPDVLVQEPWVRKTALLPNRRL